MTRNTAREIAAHLAYEWNFTDLPVGEFLDRRLAPECFAELAPECGLYADAPNAKQAQYIRRLVAGVADHAAELDDYIARYAQGWRFERIPLMASAVMRVPTYAVKAPTAGKLIGLISENGRLFPFHPDAYQPS